MTEKNALEEAQDLLMAVVAQRDAHANNEARLSAALTAANRKIAELEDHLKKSKEGRDLNV